jgi:hypothetical protein
MKEFTQEEIIAIVDRYIEENYPISEKENDFVAIRKRRSRSSHAVAIEIIVKIILPTKRDFSESLGAIFIAKYLVGKGIGTSKEVGGIKEEEIPFENLSKTPPQPRYWYQKDQYA